MVQFCKICAEKLSDKEKLRGTCKDCENAIARNVLQKISKGYFPKRIRIKAK